VSQALDSYRFNDAAGVLYNFVWHEFCDWYLEAIKPVLYEKEGTKRKEATLSVLWRVLHDTMILLHPFTPFVTEEIWDKLPGTKDSIMKSMFPLDAGDNGLYRDMEAESTMALISGIISGIRNIRGEMNISPSLSLAVTVHSQEESTRRTIEQYKDMIINLARLKSLLVENTGLEQLSLPFDKLISSSAENTVRRPKSAATSVVDNATIFVHLEGIIDFAQEINRLDKEINKLTNELSIVSKKLRNEDFLSKAPKDVVEKVREKQEALMEKQQKLQTNLDKIKELET
jgi:valyl-tRNA synthetase